MITYKYFRDKFFVLSYKDRIEPVLLEPKDQDDTKPVGMWFSKGLQWFNLALNSHHKLYNTDPTKSKMANKTYYLHEVSINLDKLTQVKREADAIKICGELVENKNENVWQGYVENHPDKHGIYFPLNNKYNVEIHSRRNAQYPINTRALEERNRLMFKAEAEKYLNRLHRSSMQYWKNTPELKMKFSHLYKWYPFLSVDSGCIWDGEGVINYDKCKLVLEIPPDILLACKNSPNSIQALIAYINANNLIANNSIETHQLDMNALFKNSISGSNRLRKSSKKKSSATVLSARNLSMKAFSGSFGFRIPNPT